MSNDSSGPDGATSTSPEAIEAAIVARRAHLAGTLDELAERVKPANLAHDAKDAATSRARKAVSDEDGNVLYERVAAMAVAAVTLVVAVVVLRSRSKR